MEAESQRSKGRQGAVLVLDTAIEALNLAKELSSITPVKVVFGAVGVVLTMIRDEMINQVDYVELGLACADVCRALDRGLSGKRLSDLNGSVREAINQLTIAVATIQRRIVKQGKRCVILRYLHAKNDKEKIAAWRLELTRILDIFNTELAINTHVIVSEIHRCVARRYGGIVSERSMTSDNRLATDYQEERARLEAHLAQMEAERRG